MFKNETSAETVIVWKVYTKCQGSFFSPMYYAKPIKAGSIVSNRQTTRWPLKSEPYCSRQTNHNHTSPLRCGCCFHLYKGIHVCLTRKAARKLKAHYGSYSRHAVVKCTAKMKDFVACDQDGHQAVFTEIHISPEELERGKKHRN